MLSFNFYWPSVGLLFVFQLLKTAVGLLLAFCAVRSSVGGMVQGIKVGLVLTFEVRLKGG